MRPVTRNNPGYNIPANIQINRVSIRQPLATEGIQPVSGVATFSIAQILTFLNTMTFLNVGTPDWGALNANRRFLIPQLISLFTTSGTAGYGNARGPLIQNFGEMCSYCEMTVQDSSLAVEHVLPKAVFPGVMINYDNFLLACPVCNSVKGSKPTYNESFVWAVNQFGIPFPTYQDILNAGVDRSTSPALNNAYIGFAPNLYGVNNNLIPRQNSLDVTNSYVSTINNQVRANINGLGQIIVSNFFNGVGNALAQLQNTNLLTMVGLNRVVVGEFSDRRVANRTVAWLDALSAVGRLNLIFQNDQTPGKVFYLAMVQQVVETVRSAGYFSTWAAIFYAWSPPLNNQWSFYSYLRSWATNPNTPQYYIPGTNAGALPTQ